MSGTWIVQRHERRIDFFSKKNPLRKTIHLENSNRLSRWVGQQFILNGKEERNSLTLYKRPEDILRGLSASPLASKRNKRTDRGEEQRGRDVIFFFFILFSFRWAINYTDHESVSQSDVDLPRPLNSIFFPHFFSYLTLLQPRDKMLEGWVTRYPKSSNFFFFICHAMSQVKNTTGIILYSWKLACRQRSRGLFLLHFKMNIGCWRSVSPQSPRGSMVLRDDIGII